MNKSESIKNIAKALSQFQSEIKNPKNVADNPFFKSKYCPLNEVIDATKPILTKYGLCVLQMPSGDGQNITITTLLMHESGEWIESEPLTLKADKATAQGAGSAITYGRRYSLSAMLGISSEDDDDGNHASGNNNKPKSINNKPNKPEDKSNIVTATKPTSDVQKESQFMCADCGVEIGMAVKNYSLQNYNKQLCVKCQNKNQKSA